FGGEQCEHRAAFERRDRQTAQAVQDFAVPALIRQLAQLRQQRRFVRERAYHTAPARSLPRDRVVGEVWNLDIELLVRLIVRRPEGCHSVSGGWRCQTSSWPWMRASVVSTLPSLL